MRIGVLIPGHLRAWDYCKSNFLETVCDSEHEIFVFVDTYHQVYRSDYKLHDEYKMQRTMSYDEIKDSFSGINLVSLVVENEKLGDASSKQGRKILNCYNRFKQFEQKFGRFDLCIKTRTDILLDQKLDYERIKKEVTKFRRVIYIGDGIVRLRFQNDIFAATNSETFEIYCERFLEYPDCVHQSMNYIRREWGVEYNQTVGISIVRLGGEGKEVEHNGIKYKVFK